MPLAHPTAEEGGEMDVAGLPRWAIPFDSESRGSWLAATRQCLPVDESDWALWLHASEHEPECPAADAVEGWQGMPEQLGAISDVAPCWRLGPEQRRIYCEQCYIGHGKQRRWPTCIPWLDARRLICSRHDRILVYRMPSANGPVAPDVRILIPEVAQLCQWLSDWLELDRNQEQTRFSESLWRRDLVTMAMRNWNPMIDVGAYAFAAWEMQIAGWDLPGSSKGIAPGSPGRLGHLPAVDRIGALLTALRYWRRLEGRSQRMSPLIAESGWIWFERRWRHRANLARRRRLAHLREATEQAQHVRLKSRANVSPHRCRP